MLTRRTALFGELAVGIEERLATLAIEMEPKVIDDILRQRIDKVAELMRITPRSALVYTPDDLPDLIAQDITLAIKAMDSSSPEHPGTKRSTSHLRRVK